MPIGRICWAARLRVAAPARNPWGSLCSRRYAASLSSQAAAEADLWRTRNIGIIAHIDAGKTTTTERMLYYSGHTRRIGDVDEGSTVTDFLPAERARGITIQSAAITFNWPPSQESAANSSSPSSPQGKDDLVPRSSISHNINLIDTPGHADFTFEVLRSLRILDGAVCILDGVAGVEAQTEKVWVQADHYKIPRIIYVNKLDRDGAAFAKTVKEIAVRLHSYPAVCQVPWWNDDGVGLKGVGDVVNMRGMLWERGSDGRAINAISWNDLQHVDLKLYEEMKKARIALVELLSNHDDEMVEKFLEHDEDHLAIPPKDIVESLRRCALQSPQMVVPVFGGASFKNIGVQPLLDAVVDLLPSPQERPDPEISIAGQTGALQDLLSGQLVINEPAPPTPAKGKKAVQQRTKTSIAAAVQNLRACALAFKVVNDARRGVLVYVRVYSGTLDRNSLLYNTNLNVTEKAPRLLKMYANDAVEVPSISAGQIGVIVGLKFARTGDTLISYPGGNFKSGPPAPINSLQLRPINVPPPVFFTSVEPNSLSEEKYLTETLAVLLREDPSLSVSVDPESGQTHLAGMGELHLEIARDRLLNDFKAKATTGKIEIGYREAIQTPSSPVTETIVREIAGKSAQAACTATVRPLELESTTGSEDNHLQTISEVDSNRLIIRHPDFTIAGESVSPESPALPPTMPFPSIISSIKAGVTAALSRGPNHGFPISAAEVIIDFDPSKHIFPDTTPAALSAAVRQAVRACIKQSSEAEGTAIMEPVMLATITVNESDLGSVMHDISSARGGQVVSLDGDSTESLTNPVSTTSLDDMPIIDPATVYTPPDPFAADGGGNFVSATDRQRHITARVPLKEMVGYLRHLRSLTGGRGTFLMQVDRFEKMSAQRQRALVNEMSGDYV